MSRFAGRVDGDGGEASERHQLLAVARDHQHATIGLGLGEPEPDERCAAHRSPQVVVGVVIPAGVDVVGGRAETGDDKGVAALGEQECDSVASFEDRGHRVHHFFLPSMRCPISTAIC